MKKCKVVLKKIMPENQVFDSNRNTSSVETVVWRVKTPNSPIDLSASSDIEMIETSTVITPTVSTASLTSATKCSRRL